MALEVAIFSSIILWSMKYLKDTIAPSKWVRVGDSRVTYSPFLWVGDSWVGDSPVTDSPFYVSRLLMSRWLTSHLLAFDFGILQDHWPFLTFATAIILATSKYGFAIALGPCQKEQHINHLAQCHINPCLENCHLQTGICKRGILRHPIFNVGSKAFSTQ